MCWVEEEKIKKHLYTVGSNFYMSNRDQGTGNIVWTRQGFLASSSLYSCQGI